MYFLNIYIFTITGVVRKENDREGSRVLRTFVTRRFPRLFRHDGIATLNATNKRWGKAKTCAHSHYSLLRPPERRTPPPVREAHSRASTRRTSSSIVSQLQVKDHSVDGISFRRVAPSSGCFDHHTEHQCIHFFYRFKMYNVLNRTYYWYYYYYYYFTALTYFFAFFGGQNLWSEFS